MNDPSTHPPDMSKKEGNIDTSRPELPTLRDYFAASALTGLMGDSGMRPNSVEEMAHAAIRLYQMADAMLRARERKDGP